jgi:hypothetical protein
MLLRTRIYQCPACKSKMKRKSKFKSFPSWCAIGQKDVRLKLVSKVKS